MRHDLKITIHLPYLFQKYNYLNMHLFKSVRMLAVHNSRALDGLISTVACSNTEL